MTSKEPGVLIASLSDSTVVLCDRELRILAVEGPVWPADLQPVSTDLRGQPLSEAIAPEPLARLQPCLDAALEGEAAYTEYGPDREDRSFAVQVLPLRLGADQVFGVLLVTRDVTAERRAELELLRSEAQLAQAQRIAHIGSWEWHLRSGEVTWSDELYRVFGLSPKHFKPGFESYLEHVHPSDRERVERLVRHSQAEGIPLHYDCRIVRADGEVRRLEAYGEILLDEHGNPERMLGTAQDITARKTAEERLALLSQLTPAIAGAGSVEEALTLTLRTICEQTRWLHGEAWLRGPDGVFRSVATWQADRSRFEDFLEAGRALTVDPGFGLVGRVWRERQPEWVEDIVTDPDFLRREQAREAGLGATMAIPVLAADDAVAVLVFFDEEPRPHDERLMGLVSGVAAQLGMSIRRRRVEDELHRKRLQLAQAQSIAQIGSWEWDLVTGEVMLSDEARRISGIERETLPRDYEAMLAVVHPDDRERARFTLTQALEDRAWFDFDHRILRSDGEVRRVHSQGTVVVDDDGRPVRVVGTAHDVTDRTQLEEESSRFWDMSRDLLAIGTLDGHFKRINPAYERLLGYSEPELVEQPFAFIVHPADRDRLMAEVRRLAEFGGQASDIELRVRCKDGSYRLLLCSATVSADAGLLYAVSMDITERKLSEEALRSAHAELESRANELERSNLELEQFAYDASHDLTEPLSIMSQLAARLATKYRDQLDDEAAQIITSIVDGSERMQMLINDLLEYSRTYRDPLERRPVDCAAVLTETLDLLADTIAEKGGTVTHDPMPTISANPIQIGKVFQNLLSNAIKFSDGLPRVHFAARRERDGWHFAVSDNGIGIDPLHAARVFEMFRRLNPRDTYAGTGLGLSICKRVVERHGGRIWVEPGGSLGSVFHFTIPDEPA